MLFFLLKSTQTPEKHRSAPKAVYYARGESSEQKKEKGGRFFTVFYRVTEVIRTRFGSVNLRLRCVRELNNTQSILCALFLPQTKIYPTEILRPPSAYLRDISGAEDEARYSPFEDDKPKRAVNTRSEAGSDNFCHPMHIKNLTIFVVFLFILCYNYFDILYIIEYNRNILLNLFSERMMKKWQARPAAREKALP